MKHDFDVIVIGAGSGGLTAAIGFAKVGKKVLLVERDQMGGECTNSGCIPSKSLIHHAKRYAEAKAKAGETDQLRAYKSNILGLVRKKIEEVRVEESPEVLKKEHGIKVFFGEGQLKDRYTVLIKSSKETLTHTAKTIVISTGSSARRVRIPGLDESKILTNENLFKLSEIPKRLLVIGGGPIGCEMAQALHHLGTKITIVTNTATIVPREEPAVAALAQEQFIAQGIGIISNAHVKSCEGGYAMIEQMKGKAAILHKVSADLVLMGLGRTANLEHLNLDAVGIAYDEQGIKVDRHYRSSCKNVFAIGDVASALKFTHTAEDQGRHIFKKVIFPWLRDEQWKPVPRVTYLDDEIASVGITSEQAEQDYGKRAVITITVPYGSSDRAKTDEVSSGVAMVVAKRLTGRILGASLMGKNAGELISVFTLAIQQRISLYKLNTMIVPYPVLGQLYKKLSDTYIGETLKHLKPDLKYMLRRSAPLHFALLLMIIVVIILLNS
jgi:pyruvate/2-oxoglutarate dehydrogenase complex dihydrolipoamide dehydrogenase (E3) component